MLGRWHNVEKLLVDRLVLAAGVDPLHPGVVPVRVELLTRHVHRAMFQRKDGAVLAEAHLQRAERRILLKETS